MGVLRNFLQKNNDAEHCESTETTNSSDEVVRVNIWENGITTGLGHASIQVGGRTAKLTRHDKGDYGSIWPKNLPSSPLLAFWPLKASIAKTLSGDAKAQAHKDAIDAVSVGPRIPAFPDRVYEIRGLNAERMHREMKAIKKGTEEGLIRYQLFPSISVVSGFVNRITPAEAAILAEDPFSGLPNDHLAASLEKTHRTPLKVLNCTVMVEDVLKAGGMPIVTKHGLFKAPWGITPNGLAKLLERDPRVKRVL